MLGLEKSRSGGTFGGGDGGINYIAALFAALGMPSHSQPRILFPPLLGYLLTNVSIMVCLHGI